MYANILNPRPNIYRSLSAYFRRYLTLSTGDLDLHWCTPTMENRIERVQVR